MDQLSFDVPAPARRTRIADVESEPVPAGERHSLRRRTRRAWCNTPVQVDGSERSLIGVCHDLSLGGMFFLGPPLPVGEPVVVTLDLPSLSRVRISGEVLDHRHHRNGSGMAIRFVRLAQSDLANISRFVAARSS